MHRRQFVKQLAIGTAVGLSANGVLLTGARPASASVPSYCEQLEVSVHLQDVGWRPAVGPYAGSVGEHRRLEGIRIKGHCQDITYQAHVARRGWQPPVSNGASAGITGASLAIEALRVRANPGHIWYMVHCEGLGWTGPYKDWEIGGTTAQSRRCEAVALRLSNSGSLNLPAFSGLVSRVVTLDGDCEKRISYGLGNGYFRHTDEVHGDVWIDDPFYQVFGPNTGNNTPFELKGLSHPTAPVYDDGSVRVEILRKTESVSIWLTKYHDHVHYHASTDSIARYHVSCDRGHLQFRISLKGRRR